MAAQNTKTYIDDAGESSRHANAGAIALVFNFDGTEHRVTLADFPEDTLKVSAWHGLSQKLGDSYASNKDKDETAEELFLNQLDALKRGDWVKARESAGPRTTIIATALQRLRSDKYADTKAAQSVVAEWTKEERTAKLKVPALAAEIAKIKAERAVEAATKLSEVEGDGGAAEL